MSQLKRIGNFIAVIGELLGLVLSILFLHKITGLTGDILGIVFYPFTWAYLPLYKLFAYRGWDLVLTNYGSLAIALLFYSFAERTAKQSLPAADEPPTHPVMTKTLKDYLAPAVVLFVISGLILAALISVLR